ncbi:hypothetical protein Pmani_006988 [Petrolisthes manimaculis]|uniref:Uncharacterized protein n=1 Tax=Petrolisthes manimaculis TaxID=1843537 RepID=A0AAE1UL46_9EUCA|nr:hypothetical protein Pmani_006988 [Petrolisthes manimaculis]
MLTSSAPRQGRGCEERGRGSGRRRESNQREGGEEKLDGRPEGAGHGEGVGIRNQEPPPREANKSRTTPPTPTPQPTSAKEDHPTSHARPRGGRATCGPG